MLFEDWLSVIIRGTATMMVVHVAACAAWLAASAALLRPKWAGRALGEGLFSARGAGVVLGLAVRTFPLAVMGPVLAALAWRWAVGVDEAWTSRAMQLQAKGWEFAPLIGEGVSLGVVGLFAVICSGWLLHGMAVAWGIKRWWGRGGWGRGPSGGERVCVGCGYSWGGGPCPECGGREPMPEHGRWRPRYLGCRLGVAAWVVVPLLALAGMTAPVWLAWIGAALPLEVYLKWMPY